LIIGKSAVVPSLREESMAGGVFSASIVAQPEHPQGKATARSAEVDPRKEMKFPTLI